MLSSIKYNYSLVERKCLDGPEPLSHTDLSFSCLMVSPESMYQQLLKLGSLLFSLDLPFLFRSSVTTESKQWGTAVI